MPVLSCRRGALIVRYQWRPEWELCPQRRNKCYLVSLTITQTDLQFLYRRRDGSHPWPYIQNWPPLVLHCGNCMCASSATTGYCDPTTMSIHNNATLLYTLEAIYSSIYNSEKCTIPCASSITQFLNSLSASCMIPSNYPRVLYVYSNVFAATF